jgi:hypothetical protein
MAEIYEEMITIGLEPLTAHHFPTCEIINSTPIDAESKTVPT